MMRSFISLFFFSSGAVAATTDQFVDGFCKAVGTPVGEATFLVNIKPNDDLFPCYAGMGYAVPNMHFNGKQWSVERMAEVSETDAIRSAVTYFGFQLAEERPGRDVYRDTLDRLGIGVPSKAELREFGKGYSAFLKELQFKSRSIGRGEEQSYFPDGPLKNGSSSTLHVPSHSTFHQYTSVFGDVQNFSRRVNAIGVWGNAASRAAEAKVWGGFFTARNQTGMDAQLVGVEIDVLNSAKAGVPPNASKVGLQVVTIGDYDSSAAVEVLSDHKSRWRNGVLFQDGSIAAEGSAIAIANKDPIRYGIDASQQEFSGAAVLLRKKSRIVFRGEPGKDTFMTSDDFDNGHVVLGGGLANRDVG